MNKLKITDALDRPLEIGSLVSYAKGTRSSYQSIAKIYDIVPLEQEIIEYHTKLKITQYGLWVKLISKIDYGWKASTWSKSGFKYYYEDLKFDHENNIYVKDLSMIIKDNRYILLDWLSNDLINNKNLHELMNYVVDKKKK